MHFTTIQLRACAVGAALATTPQVVPLAAHHLHFHHRKPALSGQVASRGGGGLLGGCGPVAPLGLNAVPGSEAEIAAVIQHADEFASPPGAAFGGTPSIGGPSTGTPATGTTPGKPPAGGKPGVTNPTAVPEPVSLALLSGGVIALAMVLRR